MQLDKIMETLNENTFGNCRIQANPKPQGSKRHLNTQLFYCYS